MYVFINCGARNCYGVFPFDPFAQLSGHRQQFGPDGNDHRAHHFLHFIGWHDEVPSFRQLELKKIAL